MSCKPNPHIVEHAIAKCFNGSKHTRIAHYFSMHKFKYIKLPKKLKYKSIMCPLNLQFKEQVKVGGGGREKEDESSLQIHNLEITVC